MWELANKKKNIHVYSVIIHANQVNEHLSSEKNIQGVIDFCRKNGITKVNIETFRNDHVAKKEYDQVYREAGRVRRYSSATAFCKASASYDSGRGGDHRQRTIAGCSRPGKKGPTEPG